MRSRPLNLLALVIALSALLVTLTGGFARNGDVLDQLELLIDVRHAIVAGYVYTGSDIPALKGLYVFGDWAAPIFKNGKRQNGFGDGRLFVTNLDDEKPVIQEVEMSIAGKPLTDMINAFGQDHSGEMYVLTAEDPDPAGDGGKVYRIAPAK